MTKTTAPKTPKLPRASRAKKPSMMPSDIEMEVIQSTAGVETLMTELVEPSPTTELVEPSPTTEWIDPIKWIDETPSIDQAMKALVLTKTRKPVKTVKTGVGAQILYLIAEGVLSNKEIVAKVLEDNPLRKTSYACVAWYKSQVAAGKIDLPKVEAATE